MSDAKVRPPVVQTIKGPFRCEGDLHIHADGSISGDSVSAPNGFVLIAHMRSEKFSFEAEPAEPQGEPGESYTPTHNSPAPSPSPCPEPECDCNEGYGPDADCDACGGTGREWKP